MPFVNEKISDEDYEGYRIAEIDKKQIVGATRSKQWTICRERDVYIRQLTVSRFEISNDSTWSLYQQGFLLSITTKNVRAEMINDDLHLHIEVNEISGDMPEGVTLEDSLSNFKEARMAFRSLTDRYKPKNIIIEMDVKVKAIKGSEPLNQAESKKKFNERVG